MLRSDDTAGPPNRTLKIQNRDKTKRFTRADLGLRICGVSMLLVSPRKAIWNLDAHIDRIPCQPVSTRVNPCQRYSAMLEYRWSLEKS